MMEGPMVPNRDYNEQMGAKDARPQMSIAIESINEQLRRLDTVWERHEQCLEFVLRPPDDAVVDTSDQLAALRRMTSPAAAQLENIAGSLGMLIDRIQLVTDRLDT